MGRAEDSDQWTLSVDAFEEFVDAVEPGLRRALVAGFGPEVGRDATVDAIAWAWQHWSRVEAMHNPGGFSTGWVERRRSAR